MASTRSTCRRWSLTGETSLTGGSRSTSSTSTLTSKPPSKVGLLRRHVHEGGSCLSLTCVFNLHPGIDIHYLHVKPKKVPEGTRAVPLIMVHGWPGSFYEFYGLMHLLTEPSGPDDLVFEVVCPSIPGYGFSEASHKKGELCWLWHVYPIITIRLFTISPGCLHSQKSTITISDVGEMLGAGWLQLEYLMSER